MITVKFFRGEEKMGILELFITAVALSMDAFAVAMCKGLATQKVKWKHMMLAGIWFGGFQALMPLIGYFIGHVFSESEVVKTYDHWIAFVLLGFLGIKMIWEAIKSEDEPANGSFAVREMFLMAIATSIDALASGIAFATVDVNIVWAVAFIGILTFLFSAFGVKLGNIFGEKFKNKAELAGGVILFLMGLKILLEHLGILLF